MAVGQRPSCARFRVADHREVRRLLRELVSAARTLNLPAIEPVSALELTIKACVSWGSMIHSVPSTGRVAAPWPLSSRWADRLGQTVTAVLRRVLRRCGLGNDMPELGMSREWLEEHERQSRKHSDGV